VEIGRREGIGNANLLNAKYLLVVCGEEEIAYDVKNKPSLKSLEKYRIPQIPIAYGKLPEYRYKKGGGVFFDLRKANFNELKNKFQRCHDEIWEGGKRDPAESFDEMSKIMFAKIYDERFTKRGKYYKFQIGTNEDNHIIAERVKELYKSAQSKEPDVFIGELKVPDRIIKEVVEILQDISLMQTDLDAKGRAFEHFLSEIFRGKLGQYFTRREIVEFMVSMLDPTENDLVIDPACGSGGFLLYSMKSVREKIRRDYAGDEKSINRIDYDFSHDQIFGIEINDRIARVAMMDMVIHDDGHSNIECHDALDDYKNFSRKRDIRSGKYSLLLTNPPFGAVYKNEKSLKSFELGSRLRKRNSQKTEILYIERCLDLLKPGGRMGIVSPDGILTNSSLQYVRNFIQEKARILAVVSLPHQTFVPAGSGVKASLLFLQKKKEGEKLGDYPIFMAIADHVGYDATGRPDKNDFPNILEDWEKFKRGKLE
jgi:type I restriction enzyme M protein